jgi:hypothetical protein
MRAARGGAGTNVSVCCVLDAAGRPLPIVALVCL